MKVTKNSLGLLEELKKISSTKHSKDWHPYKIIPRKIPDTVQASLREYQKEGVNWLCFLRKNDFGGILFRLFSRRYGAGENSTSIDIF